MADPEELFAEIRDHLQSRQKDITVDELLAMTLRVNDVIVDMRSQANLIAQQHAQLQAAFLARMADLLPSASAEEVRTLADAYMALPRPFEDDFDPRLRDNYGEDET